MTIKNFLHRNNNNSNNSISDKAAVHSFTDRQHQQVPISSSLTPTALPTDNVQVATNEPKPEKMPFTLRRAEASDVDDILRFVLGQLTYQIR